MLQFVLGCRLKSPYGLGLRYSLSLASSSALIAKRVKMRSNTFSMYCFFWPYITTSVCVRNWPGLKSQRCPEQEGPELLLVATSVPS